jgi:hypothetical protein
MDKIKQCISDVVVIATRPEHCVEAKRRIEQLFAETDVRSRSHHLAIAQRVRDQLMQRCTVADDEATQCLGELIDWLDQKEFSRRR